MQNKKLVASLLVSSVMFTASITAFAETTDNTNPITITVTQPSPSVNITEIQTTTPTAEDQKLASALAKTYNTTVTAQEIADLHATHVGYGEISKAYGFAALSGKSVSDVLGMKEKMGWGEIAEATGVKVSDVTKKDEAVQHAMNTNTSKENGKPASQKEQKTTHSGNSSSGNNGNGNSNGGGNGNGGGHGGGHR